MTYKIGTRVKCKGYPGWQNKTGIVCSGKIDNHQCDMTVMLDQEAIDLHGVHRPPGAKYQTASQYWQPITDPGATPGIKGTCEPLDKLLSEVSRETI